MQVFARAARNTLLSMKRVPTAPSSELAAHQPRLLRHGDQIRVGRVWLEIQTGHRPTTPELNLATRELALLFMQHAMNQSGLDTTATVRVVEGPDAGMTVHLTHTDQPLVVGRSDRCDVTLRDEDISREHVAIACRGGQVFIRDTGSLNGMRLGNVPVTRDREWLWRPNVPLALGSSVLTLDEPVSAALAAVEAATDEPLDEADAPPPPVSSRRSPARADAPPPSAPPSALAAVPSVPPRATGWPTSTAQPEPASARTKNVHSTQIPKPAHRPWSRADVALVWLAAFVIAASLGGLVWVLR